MIIPLQSLPDDGLRFEHEYKESDLDLREHELKLVEPLRVAGTISRAGRDIRVRGRLGTQIARACDRCLAAVSLTIDLPFDLFYEPNEIRLRAKAKRSCRSRILNSLSMRMMRSTLMSWL